MEKDLFDEEELNALCDAVGHKVRTTKWDLDDDSQWQYLVILKGLQARILDLLEARE